MDLRRLLFLLLGVVLPVGVLLFLWWTIMPDGF